MSVLRGFPTSLPHCGSTRRHGLALPCVALALALTATGAGQASAAGFDCPSGGSGTCTVTGVVAWDDLVAAGFSKKLSDLTFEGTGGSVTFSEDTTPEATSGTTDQLMVVGEGVAATLSVAGGKKLTITGNTVTGSGNVSGAAIRNLGTLTLSGAFDFIGNSASSDGAGVKVAGAALRSDKGEVIVAGPALFKDNKITASGIDGTAWGGAVQNYIYLPFTFKDVVRFEGNTAYSTALRGGSTGGAVNSMGTMTFEKFASFVGNVADSRGDDTIAGGGAISNSQHMNFMSEAFFEGNTASARGNSIRTFGGAIYNSANTLIFHDKATFSKNTARVAGNGGYAWGGALYNSLGATTFKKEVTFSENLADGLDTTGNVSGGAILADTSGSLTFEGTATFSKNTARSVNVNRRISGGAIVNYGNTFTFSEDAFFTENKALATGNTAVTYGGAIANQSAITFARAATFAGNLSQSTGTDGHAYGGALTNLGSSSVMAFNGSATFRDNTAKSDTGDALGGAIVNFGILTFASDVTFQGNKAESTSGSGEGGAIYNQLSDITLSGETKFLGNLASAAGGAIYSLGGTIALEPAAGKTILFSGNTAGGKASSIHLISGVSSGVNIDSVLKVGGAGTVDMKSDPMGGEVYSGRSITVTKDSTGTWWLGGESVFTADDNADSRTDFQVKNGTLAFASGAAGGTTVDLRGLKSAFALEAPATLRLEGDSHKILAGNGGLNPDTGTGGTITLAAGSTLTFDLDSARQKTAVLTLRAENVVLPTASGETVNLDVRSFKNVVGAEYWLLDAGVDLTDRVTLKYRGETIVGSSLEGALVGELSADKKVQKLIVKQLPNRKLTWVGDSNTWNTTIADKWRLPDGTTLTVFLPGDAVEFIPEHTGTVDINAGGVVVAGMEIKGGTFTFTGGEI
ncbi:hypothetical protein IHV25_10160, partial [Phaeovibrio sulfidiphilus]